MDATGLSVHWSDFASVTPQSVDGQIQQLQAFLAGQRYTLIVGLWDRSLPGFVSTGIRLSDICETPIVARRAQMSESRPGRRQPETVTILIHQAGAQTISFGIPATKQAGECRFRIYPADRKAILLIQVPHHPPRYWIFALESH